MRRCICYNTLASIHHYRIGRGLPPVQREANRSEGCLCQYHCWSSTAVKSTTEVDVIIRASHQQTSNEEQVDPLTRLERLVSTKQLNQSVRISSVKRSESSRLRETHLASRTHQDYQAMNDCALLRRQSDLPFESRYSTLRTSRRESKSSKKIIASA